VKLERDIGATGCAKTRSEIANKCQTLRETSNFSVLEARERRRRPANPAQEPAQDASAGIDIRSFAKLSASVRPHC